MTESTSTMAAYCVINTHSLKAQSSDIHNRHFRLFQLTTCVKSGLAAPAACDAMRRDAPRDTVALIKYIISKFP